MSQKIQKKMSTSLFLLFYYPILRVYNNFYFDLSDDSLILKLIAVGNVVDLSVRGNRQVWRELLGSWFHIGGGNLKQKGIIPKVNIFSDILPNLWLEVAKERKFTEWDLV